jgi:hypothetical protein
METSRSEPPFQFGLRTLFGVTALCAVAAWNWPFRDDPDPLLHGFGVILFVAIVASAFLVRPAYRRLIAGESDNLLEERAKRLAFFAAVLGMIPYGSIGLIAWLESQNPENPGPLFAILAYIAFISYGPSILFVTVSLTLYTGRRENPELFCLRVIGLITNLAYAVVFLTSLGLGS